jgi:hypothetical protein
LRQAPNEINDVPDPLILMRGSECGHSGHFNAILDDPKQFRATPPVGGFSEIRRLWL